MLIDGKKIQQQILATVREDIAALPFQPVFSDVLVGDNPVSLQYVKMKARMAETLGIAFKQADIPGDVSTEALIEEIQKLNTTENMCGLIVQLPLPPVFDQKKVLDAVDPTLDVDATGEINSSLFYSNTPRFVFPTAAAVMTILDTLGLSLEKEKILVIGQGQLVGKPVAHLLRARGLTITAADKKTENMPERIREATVIISATGRGKLIDGSMISEGVVIIDAGTSESGGSIVGDVDFESVKDKARALSPVPGGVGPVTVAELFRNVLLSAKQKMSK